MTEHGAMHALRLAAPWAAALACAACALACSQDHGACTPGSWRACERFCTFEQCTPAASWSGACVEHGGPCDAGPPADTASADGAIPVDGDASARIDAASELDGGSADASFACGVWTCTGSQRCIETCHGYDVGISDHQCVDVPPGCAPTDCACLAAHDPCVLCASPSYACDLCTVSGS